MTETERTMPASPEPRTSSLGEFLKDAREAGGLTLRQVEERTKGRVKNGYLSQVETDRIGRPSPEILWHLSEALGVSYSELLSRAGHRVPNANPAERRRAINGIPLSAIQELTPGERDELVRFMSYLRHRRRSDLDGA
jgi:HTH-type transcriptional regulator, competence development regulator